MGQITTPKRIYSQLEGLPEGARILDRIARPLTGREVGEALKRHILELSSKLPCDHRVKEDFEEQLIQQLVRQSELQKINLVYPGVGWRVTIVKEMAGDGGLENLWASVELDLQQGTRKNLLIGENGRGEELERIEEEQIQTKAPDRMRERHSLPVEVDWVKPGTSERGKAQFARKVEVGRGALSPITVERSEVGLTTAEAQKEARQQDLLQKVVERPVEELIGEVPFSNRKVSVLGTVNYKKIEKGKKV